MPARSGSSPAGVSMFSEGRQAANHCCSPGQGSLDFAEGLFTHLLIRQMEAPAETLGPAFPFPAGMVSFFFCKGSGPHFNGRPLLLFSS